MCPIPGPVIQRAPLRDGVEQRAHGLWRWIAAQVGARWAQASVRPVRYSGINHRYCCITLPSGRYHVLGVTESALEGMVLEELTRRLESEGWLDRLDRPGCPGLLLCRGGRLEEWSPHAGATSL